MMQRYNNFPRLPNFGAANPKKTSPRFMFHAFHLHFHLPTRLTHSLNSPPNLGGARGGLRSTSGRLPPQGRKNKRYAFPFSLAYAAWLIPKRPNSHATGRSNRRQKCCERGYYHLHRQLNHSLLLHTRIFVLPRKNTDEHRVFC